MLANYVVIYAVVQLIAYIVGIAFVFAALMALMCWALLSLYRSIMKVLQNIKQS